MLNIFNKSYKNEKYEQPNTFVEMSLQQCFEEYYNSKKEIFSKLKADTNFGKSFACFSTSVVLHNIFKNQKLGDITVYWTDNTGDGKIDGIAIALDGTICHHPRTLELKGVAIKNIDLYFIQAKKHKTKAFCAKEFEEFTDGVTEFLWGEAIADRMPSYSIQSWKLLWLMLNDNFRNLKNDEKPQINIHFYCAMWGNEKLENDFLTKKNELIKVYKNEHKVNSITFDYVNGDFLKKKYLEYKNSRALYRYKKRSGILKEKYHGTDEIFITNVPE